MIITRLSGGLGNQIFQYAMGRAISLRQGSILRIDISSFDRAEKGKTPRAFALTPFSIVSETAREKDFNSLGIPSPRRNDIFSRVHRRFIRILDSRRRPQQRRFFVDGDFAFLQDAFDAGPNCYVAGNWQSEKYFTDVADTIRRDLSLRDPLSNGSSRILDEISKTNSVSVHVRRGDYVSINETSRIHGICSPEYYRLAITLIAKRVSTPTFFVFSDDIEWVRDNLSFGYPTRYVSGSHLSDQEELILMSKCSHSIIANSSFSWWGAWLNDHSDKIVISPRQWFRDSKTDTHDLIPPTWTVV